jgi:hypothetical protein
MPRRSAFHRGGSGAGPSRVLPAQLMTVVTVLAGALAIVRPAAAQRIEVTPFAGYRLGWGYFEFIASSDFDGAPSFGAAVDVPIGHGEAVEVLFTRQETRLDVLDPYGQPTRVPVTVDHWQFGGTQEFGRGRVRPFVAGTLGLTRYAWPGDSEVRFSLGGGGGVKLFATRHVGLRLDGRVYATFVDGDSTAGICSPGFCLIHLDVSVAWQADFTAGVTFAF